VSNLSDFDYELSQLEDIVKQSVENFLMSIKDDCMQLFRVAIFNAVYDRYKPTEWERHYKLYQMVDGYIENGKLIIHMNSDLAGVYYYSAVNGDNVGDFIPLWINDGHDDNSKIQNYYHHYPASNYVDEAKKLIESKYDIEVEIFKNSI
jgi:hypothetical protein